MTNSALHSVGPYEITTEIGRGGMAVVYQAYDRAQRRVVALKVLPPYLAHDLDLVRRFVREGQECRALQHPNIVHTYDAGEVDGVYYIAMEYLPGGSLAEALARQGRPFDLATTTAIVSQIASALDYAHGRGLLHRDIKLRNILLDGRGRAVLSDFGIAKVASHATLTPARALLGTVQTMSPEQARGQSDLDRRSDVYALGVVLYEMLTGQPPFWGEHDAVILHSILYQPPRSPHSLNPAIPPAVERVILAAMQKDRNKRYPTAGQLAAALHAAAPQPAAGLAGEAPTHRATTAGRQTALPPRAPLPSWAYALGGGAIVLAAILIIWALARPPSSAVAVSTPTAQIEIVVAPTLVPPNEPSPVPGLVPTAAAEASQPTGLTATATVQLTPANAVATRPPAGTPGEDVVTVTASAAPVETRAPLATPTRTAQPATGTPRPVTATPQQAVALLVPQLQVPMDGDTQVERVQFNWIPVPNAAGYHVETRSDRPGQTEWRAWDRLSGSETTFLLNFSDDPAYFAIPGTEYYWRVAARDAANKLTYSRERRFIMQRTQPPTPTREPTSTPTPTPEPPTATPTKEMPPTTVPPTATPTPVPPTATPRTIATT